MARYPPTLSLPRPLAPSLPRSLTRYVRSFIWVARYSLPRSLPLSLARSLTRSVRSLASVARYSLPQSLAPSPPRSLAHSLTHQVCEELGLGGKVL